MTCYPPRPEQCRQMVEVKRDCGHSARVRCGMAPEGPCREPCCRILRCGHACKAWCHPRDECGETPCQRACSVRCIHSSCKSKCSVPCAPCLENCPRKGCQHGIGPCQLACGMVCSTPRCNEPCSKLLPCGHPCPGLCGEPCLPVDYCRTCGTHGQEHVDLIEFTAHAESTDPVILLGCSHLLTVEMYDAIVRADKTQPKCPWCKEPFGAAVSPVSKYGHIHTHIRVRTCTCTCTCTSTLTLIYAQTVDLLQEKLRLHVVRQMHGLDNLNLAERRRRLRDLVRVMRDSPASKLVGDSLRRLKLDSVEELNDVLGDRFPTSLKLEQPSIYAQCLVQQAKAEGPGPSAIKASKEAIEVCLKGKHLRTIADALRMRILSSATPSGGIKPEIASSLRRNIVSIAGTLGKDELQAELERLVGQLERDVEMEEILHALPELGSPGYNGASRVLECPNGHPYFIGDCGGAMVEAICPECGERIGGGSHSARADNHPANAILRRIRRAQQRQ